MKKVLLCLLLALCMTLPALAEVPYLQKVLRPDEMIFSGPSYDEFCVGTVREKDKAAEQAFYSFVEEEGL